MSKSRTGNKSMEVEETAASSDTEAGPSKDTTLESWTKEDKFELLQALRASGSDNIEQIQEFLSHKTPDEIQKALDHYNEIALKLKPKENADKTKEKKNASSPLAQWAELLSENLTFQELHTDIATAIRLIANYEHIPHSIATENIDFRKIYHIIANAIEGKPLPQDDSIIDVLNKCLIETALTTKSFIKPPCLKSIVSQIDVSAREINIFPTPTADMEVACILHLASQLAYNPLNISEDLLKVSHYKE